MRTSFSLLLFLFPQASFATPTFPSAVARDLNLAHEPGCTLCHTGGVTQRGTVTTPVGTSLRARGLVAYDEQSLSAALGRLEADAVDSDGDGRTDVAELRAGTNPNVADDPSSSTGGGTQPPVPTYGCTSAAGAPGASFLLAVCGLAALHRARRTVG
jgi:hypothetical protein